MPRPADRRDGRHVVHALQVHLVLVTKVRRRAITARARDILVTACRSVCADAGAELLAADGADDHLHLLVAYPPTVAITRLVNSLKGVSARRLRSAHLPDVRKVLCGGIIAGARATTPRPSAARIWTP